MRMLISPQRLLSSVPALSSKIHFRCAMFQIAKRPQKLLRQVRTERMLYIGVKDSTPALEPFNTHSTCSSQISHDTKGLQKIPKEEFSSILNPYSGCMSHILPNLYLGAD